MENYRIIWNSKVDIVPKTIVNMGGSSEDKGNSNNNTVMDTLLKFITMDKLGVSLSNDVDPSLQRKSVEDDLRLEEYKVMELEEKNPKIGI